jgi:hypothetical protein
VPENQIAVQLYDYRPRETGTAAMLRVRANKCQPDAANTANTDVGGSVLRTSDDLEEEALGRQAPAPPVG